MRRRFFTLILSIAMLLSTMPTTAMAQTLQGDGPSAEQIAVVEPPEIADATPTDSATPTDMRSLQQEHTMPALFSTPSDIVSIGYTGDSVRLVEGEDAHAYLNGSDESRLCWSYYYGLSEYTQITTTNAAGQTDTYYLYQLDDVLGGDVTATAYQTTGTRWTADDGLSHAITVKCGQLECRVPVTIAPRPCQVKSLTLANDPSELWLQEGAQLQRGGWGEYRTYGDRYYYELRWTIKTDAVYDDGSGPQSVTMVQYSTVPGVRCHIVSTQDTTRWAGGETHTVYVVAGDTALPVTIHLMKPIEKLEMLSDQPVPLIENMDGGLQWTESGEFFAYALPTTDVFLKATLSAEAAAKYNDGEKTFTGTAEDIFRLLDIDFSNDTSSQATFENGGMEPVYHPESAWQVGESHSFTLQVGGASCTVPVEVIPQPVASIAYASDQTVELRKDTDVKDDSYGDSRYDLFHSGGPRFTVTFTPSGMDRYHLAEPTLTATREELGRRTGLWIRSDNQPFEARYSVGETFDYAVSLGGNTCTVPVRVASSVVSIAPAFDVPVEMMEGEDGWEADGVFQYHLEYRDRQYTVTFTPEAARKYGLSGTTFTGGCDEICNLTGSWLEYEPTSTAPWQVGSSYEYTVSLDGVSCTVPVKIVASPVVSISYTSSQPVELVEGLDSSQGSDGSLYYRLYLRHNLSFTVTFTPEAARKYGLSDVIFTGTSNDLRTLTGLGLAYCIYPVEECPVGGPYDYEVTLGGKSCMVPVNIVASPVVSIAYASDQPMELMEDIDVSVNGGISRYCMPYETKFTVTFTPEGARQYGLSGVTFTGTIQEINSLTEMDLSYPEQPTADWPAGGSYSWTASLGGKTCTVPVRVLESPIVSIAYASDQPVELTEGYDGSITSISGKEEFSYNLFTRMHPFYQSGYRFTVTLTPEGAQRLGLTGVTFTGTQQQIGTLIGVWPSSPSYFSETWKVGGSYDCKVFLGSKSCIVPVKIMANPVVSVTYASSKTVVLPDGLGGKDWQYGWSSFALSPFGLPYTVVFTPEAARKYGLGKTTFTGTGDEICDLVGESPFDYNYIGMYHWPVGEPHVESVYLFGRECAIPVEVVANPVVSIAYASGQTVELTAGVDNCGGYRYSEPCYTLQDKLSDESLRFTVTFTAEGAKLYGCSGVTFTGTCSEIEALTGVALSSDSYDAQSWQTGGLYQCTVTLGDKSCAVPVKLVPETYVEKLLYRGKAVDLYEGGDGDEAGYGLYGLTPDMLSFTVALTSAGAEKFGRSTLTGTMEELEAWLGYSFMIPNPAAQGELGWKIGDQKGFTVYLAGKTCRVPVTIVENPVASIFCDDIIRPVLDADAQDQYDTTYDYYRSLLHSADPFITVTLTAYGAQLYGAPTLYGRCSEISKKLGRSFTFQAAEISWEPGKTYSHTVTLLNKSYPVVFQIATGTSVLLSNANFPDSALRGYLEKTFDTNNDGYILAESVRNIDCPEAGIRNTRGLEKFPGLTDLCLAGNSIETIDLRCNTHLWTLDCSGNKLRTLQLAQNTALGYLYCGGNQISTLALGDHTMLKELYCADNNMTQLTLPGAGAALEVLDCSGNTLAALDTEGCTSLRVLTCANNQAPIALKVETLDGLQLTAVGSESPVLTTADGQQGTAAIAGTVSAPRTDAQLSLHSDSQTYGSTSVSGQYQLLGVPDGSYTLEVSAEGCVPRSYACTVSDGVVDSGTLSLQLVAKGNVNGSTMPNGDEVGVDDMACLYQCLAENKVVGELKDDSAYFEAVADTNEDHVVNILDYQYLYESVRYGMPLR